MPDFVLILLAASAVASTALEYEPKQGAFLPDVPSAETAPAPASMSVSVTIQNFKFSPESVTVKRGTTVSWINRDSIQHTVTRPLEGGGQAVGPDSGVLNPGDTYSFTYNAVGFFDYRCSIHSSMQGVVEVQP